MYAAARRGYLESVVWLHELACYDQEVALEAAATNGHSDVVVWLLDHAHGSIHVVSRVEDDEDLGIISWRIECDPKQSPKYYALTKRWGFAASTSRNAALLAAARCSDIDGLHRLAAHPLFQSGLSSRIAMFAVVNGQLSVLQFLFERCPLVFQVDFVDVLGLGFAIANGHVDTAEWMVANGIGKIHEQTITDAVKSAPLNAVQWVLDKCDFESSHLDSKIQRSVEMHTTLPVLQWLVEERKLELHPWRHGKMAIGRNDTEMTKWIVSQCRTTGSVFHGQDLLLSAISVGNYELVRWFIDEHHLWHDEAFPCASAGRCVETLAFVHARALAQRDLRSTALLEVGRIAELTLDYVDTVSWLLTHGYHVDFLGPEALTGIPSTEATYTKQSSEIEQPHSPIPSRSTMRQMRSTISLLIELYDPQYLQRIPWLPLWAVRHGSLRALDRLVAIGLDTMLCQKEFLKLLRGPAREDVVQWYLEHRPAFLTPRVARWAVQHSKRSLLQWVFTSCVPAKEPLLLRKCVRTALWTAARYNRQDAMRLVLQWTPVARDPVMWHQLTIPATCDN